ncbi:MAG: GIY-YIG nuclease family protein [Cyanobacteria bacterium P01_D01_bin.36]
MTKEQQSFLLSDSAMQAASYSTYENFQKKLTISLSELRDWKARIIRFQSQLSPVAEQGSLFGPLVGDAPKSGIARDAGVVDTGMADAIEPFALRRQNTEFWRWRFEDVGVAAMYFVIDYAASAEVPLLLYVGETVKSNQRWKGEHDCKRYLLNYRQAHYDNGLNSELGIAFWPEAPAERKARQQLESDLILRWRSPFNKENWRFWNTPFVEGKA